MNKKKVLYLLEAKYRDFPPSSFSPAELLTNELDGEEGLIRFCEKQKDAVDCFVRDRPDFEQKLNFSFEGYSIKAGIVTKFAPLIKECHGIPLVEFDNLDAII